MVIGTKRQQEATGQQAEASGQSQQASPELVIKDGLTGPEAPVNGREFGSGVRQSLVKKYVNEEQLARGLGWFSIGLGLAELLAPRGVAKVAGMRGNTALIRLFGLREIASGIAIFAGGRRPAGPVWSRVVGDALDLACLGAAYATPENDKARLTFATANVLAVTALDVLCAQQLSADDDGANGERGRVPVNKSIIINAAPEEVYSYWRDFENLPRFMRYLESVTVTGEGRSHWVAKAPGGSVEWDAEMTEDVPNQRISWRSLEGSEVETSGTVRFEPAVGGRGTVLHVTLDFNPPGGAVGALFAKLWGEDPDGEMQTDLRRFKQIVELGEIVVSDGTLTGEGYTEQRPAQPLGVGYGAAAGQLQK
ncbi:MAG: SRPBCC family protein [Acidobacteria bacterium]|nr:SRPBCC family protein [Acidobacteriota bacterium]